MKFKRKEEEDVVALERSGTPTLKEIVCDKELLSLDPQMLAKQIVKSIREYGNKEITELSKSNSFVLFTRAIMNAVYFSFEAERTENIDSDMSEDDAYVLRSKQARYFVSIIHMYEDIEKLPSSEDRLLMWMKVEAATSLYEGYDNAEMLMYLKFMEEEEIEYKRAAQEKLLKVYAERVGKGKDKALEWVDDFMSVLIGEMTHAYHTEGQDGKGAEYPVKFKMESLRSVLERLIESSDEMQFPK